MKKKLTTIFLLIILFLGISLLLYPVVSDYVNSLHQSKAITEYAESINSMDTDEYKSQLESAKKFNIALSQKKSQWNLSDEEMKQYFEVLNIRQNGVMSYIEIPSIGCNLAVYHGTDAGVLQTSIGHMIGSSLPVGGSGTHCVLSGHRGLPSAKLFSDLDRLTEGDQFIIRTLNEILTYEVDQILIVLPDEVDSLRIEESKDYCTLVTCTPYGVNSHRLLVRGHRVENQNDSQRISIITEAVQIEPLIIAPILAAPMLLILFLFVLFGDKKKKE